MRGLGASQIAVPRHDVNASSLPLNCVGATALLTIAYVFGGSAAEQPGPELLIEFTAIVVLAITVGTWRGLAPPLSALLIIFAMLALPLLQLVPLPFDIWTSLPGREVAADVVAIVDPGMRMWLSLWVPVAMFLATLQTTPRERLWLAATVVALAGVSAVLGLLQVATDNPHLYLFESSHQGLPTGLFANRNHQAALMYAALPFIAALSLRRDERRPQMAGVAIALGVAVLLIAMIFATRSRSGMALMAVSLPLIAFGALRRQLGWKMIGGGILALGMLIALLFNSSIVRSAVDRLLTQSSDGRYDFWPETLYSIGVYFPAGAGLGSFIASYQATEQLAAVGTHYVNHAHNDYMEIALEAGLPGLAIVVFALAVFGWRTARLSRLLSNEDERMIASAASIVLFCFFLHSFVDYPGRTLAHLTLLGMLAGFLFEAPRCREIGANRTALFQTRAAFPAFVKDVDKQ
jgi:O-antigen ligase